PAVCRAAAALEEGVGLAGASLRPRRRRAHPHQLRRRGWPAAPGPGTPCRVCPPASGDGHERRQEVGRVSSNPLAFTPSPAAARGGGSYLSCLVLSFRFSISRLRRAVSCRQSPLMAGNVLFIGQRLVLVDAAL